MKPIISVIIPVYNVSTYLDRCLRSIRAQTLKNIEIICIDDASTDESYKILEEHGLDDKRIKVIRHLNNRGLGGARNTGIENATADYIASVDGDDYVEDNMLELLWKELKNKNYDIVCCGYYFVDDKDNKLGKKQFLEQEIDKENKDYDIFTLLNPSFWNKLWKKSLFISNNIRFTENVYFEDMPITPRLVSCAISIKIIDRCLYNYVIRHGSITNTYSNKHLYDFLAAVDSLIDFYKTSEVDKIESQLTGYLKLCVRFHVQKVMELDVENESTRSYLIRFLFLVRKHMDYFNYNEQDTQLLNYFDVKDEFLIKLLSCNQ